MEEGSNKHLVSNRGSSSSCSMPTPLVAHFHHHKCNTVPLSRWPERGYGDDDNDYRAVDGRVREIWKSVVRKIKNNGCVPMSLSRSKSYDQSYHHQSYHHQSTHNNNLSRSLHCVSLYSPSPSQHQTFSYDLDSYALNFDDPSLSSHSA